MNAKQNCQKEDILNFSLYMYVLNSLEEWYHAYYIWFHKRTDRATNKLMQTIPLNRVERIPVIKHE